MTERTLIPRRVQTEVVGIPQTCPTCRSVQIQSDHGEWRCAANGCFARSDGWNTRPSTPEDSGSGAMPAGGTEAQPPADPAASESTDAPPFNPAAALLNGVAKSRRAHDNSPTDAELLGYLVAWSRAHNDQSPNSRGWEYEGGRNTVGAPAGAVYRTRFGSWTEALKLAGLPPIKQGRPTSQPATASDAAAPAEKAAPPPPPSETAVTTPAEEDSDASEGPSESLAVRASEIEAPLATTLEIKGTTALFGFDVDHTDLATTRTHTVWAVDEARDELQLRYARSLLATLDNTEVTEPTDTDFFWQLCDRIERVIGLQEEGE